MGKPVSLTRKIRSGLVEAVSWVRVRYYRRMGTTIGRECFIALGARIDVARGKVSLGNKVELSGGSYILGHTGWEPVKEGQETHLEDNVKVFVHAIIMPGVRIGKNSIVGAGAVVTRDVPPNCVVMGNPARVVRWLERKGGEPPAARGNVENLERPKMGRVVSSEGVTEEEIQ